MDSSKDSLNFKVGDTVLCIADSKYDSSFNLPKDKVFTIVENNNGFLTFKENRLWGHMADRFVLVNRHSIETQVLFKIKEMESRRSQQWMTS